MIHIYEVLDDECYVGGIAVTEENVFSFDLNESLVFKKGQEIAELRGIELEPSLAIEPKDSYVDVRGVFELRGEYRKVDHEFVASEHIEQPHTMYNEINQIDDTAENEAVFIHEFPVDISIPIERISDEKDIQINVKTFDYELPLNNLLKISAEIQIHGLSSVSSEDLIEKSALEQLRELSQDDEEYAEEVLAESTGDEDDTKAELNELEAEPESVYEQERELFDEPEYVHKETEEPSEQLEESPLTDEEINISDMFQPEEESIDYDQEEALQSNTEEIQENDEANMIEQEALAEQEMKETDVETEELVSTETKAEMGTHHLEDDPVENTLSLLFGGKSEEHFTSMRLYIVQENDSLESIAERYDVPITKILQHNRLDSENIGEGQLVYIPCMKTTD